MLARTDNMSEHTHTNKSNDVMKKSHQAFIILIATYKLVTNINLESLIYIYV